MEKTVEAIHGLWTCVFEKPVCLKHCKKQRQDGSVYKNVFPYNLFEKKINFLIKASSDEGRKGIREWQYQNEDLVVFKVQVIPHLLPMQVGVGVVSQQCQSGCGPRMHGNSTNSEQKPCLVTVHVRSL